MYKQVLYKQVQIAFVDTRLFFNNLNFNVDIRRYTFFNYCLVLSHFRLLPVSLGVWEYVHPTVH